jgi:hypothetical protein
LTTSNSLRTIRVVGGAPFSIYQPGNPEISHDGGTSVHHLYISESELQSVTLAVKGFGAEPEVLEYASSTQEQNLERSVLLGVGSGSRVWPCVKCLECSWFDPLTDVPCGRASWPPESIESLLEIQKAVSDLEICGAKHVWMNPGGFGG